MNAATAARLPFARRLHVRLSLVALALLVLPSLALLGLARHYGVQSTLESTQRLNLGLARYIAEHQPRPLITADGRADAESMQSVATNVMMIHPGVEVYLLDRQARVIAHALGDVAPLAESVDLDAVRPLIGPRAHAAELPVLGDDPRRPGVRGIVSVAALERDGALAGYLYVVLQGGDMQALTAGLSRSQAWRTALAGAALSLAATAVVLVMALRRLTQPLRELTAQVQAFRADDDPAGGAGAGDEIALLRQAVHAMQQRIAQQFTRLEDADRMRRELVSNISHDLHTPLASIHGYVETLLLRGDQLDAATREQHLRTALRHAKRLGKRVADLFELSKLDAGRVQPRLEAFCLAELLQDVVQSYRLQAEQRGVTLALAENGRSDAQVLADIALIERVLQNLIDNALRHTPPGGSISLAVTSQGEQVKVSITDTGSGIAQEHLPHIFERYWRASDAQAVEAGPSAGLGLAIVKRILDLHGSVVKVRSELARGTHIEFVLTK
jgi:signal transduction histidine kinase